MNVAIILSGGVGSRMGINIPKQYVEVNGIPVLGYCLKTLLQNSNTDALVIGVAEEWKDFVVRLVEKFEPQKPVYFASPGKTRQYSIYNALNILKNRGYKDNDIILIHDAARPLLSNDLINRCYEACLNCEGVLPVIPVKDTLYLSTDGERIQSLLNRSHLWAGQAPEAFKFGKYLKAHQKMDNDKLAKINGSTELAYLAGMDVKLIRGDEMNFKITTPEDLSNFENIVKQRTEES